ncbi:MAG: hypothetical protein COX57_09210 [Alphaproteobacteria bacterium CG_4_10_14_0_2_um_filter_63_37]|nr:MAG: hypothetical protein AUJ55_09115 [Proteobacteria bacterium CG1_02_64_396]PJA24323.1 MAG: hypothetical protein COX57_09210 [Alphaproteobacteria bacterium CG_4_10_14_0_2_um_filter_63_37]
MLKRTARLIVCSDDPWGLAAWAPPYLASRGGAWCRAVAIGAQGLRPQPVSAALHTLTKLRGWPCPARLPPAVQAPAEADLVLLFGHTVDPHAGPLNAVRRKVWPDLPLRDLPQAIVWLERRLESYLGGLRHAAQMELGEAGELKLVLRCDRHGQAMVLREDGSFGGPFDESDPEAITELGFEDVVLAGRDWPSQWRDRIVPLLRQGGVRVWQGGGDTHLEPFPPPGDDWPPAIRPLIDPAASDSAE